MCLLVVVGDFDSLVTCLKTENDVNFVSAHRSHYAQIWMKGVDIKNPTSVLSCLSCLFSALSGRAYPQYRLCDLLMVMKHSCDDISYHEGKTTSIFFVKTLSS